MNVLNNHRGTQISMDDAATGRKAWAFFWNGLKTAAVYAQQPAPVGCDQQTFLLHVGVECDHSRDVAESLIRNFVATGNGKFI